MSLKKISFSVLFVVFLFVLSELVLSFFKIFPNDFYTATPNSGFIWKIKPGEIVGVSRDSDILFDELGARSISNNHEKQHKIVAFGGSTTACYALSQQLTWTALLEKKLGGSYWVGNFGKPGNNSNHHVMQFEYILQKPELKNVKTVLIMVGINDFLGYLISSKKYLDNKSGKMRRSAFKHMPNEAYIDTKEKLTLYKLLKNAYRKFIIYKFNTTLTKKSKEIKSLRKRSLLIDKLPSLKVGLNHYKKNIQKIIDKAKEKNITLVFITQATLWKPNLEKQYDQLLTASGFSNNTSFYSPTALDKGMTFFNEALKETCYDNEVNCINLQAPKTSAVFYDDMHFNESGARLVSDKIYEFLISNNK